MEPCKSKILEKKPKTPTSSSLPSPHAYKPPIMKSNEDTIRDTYHSLEERVLNF